MKKVLLLSVSALTLIGFTTTGFAETGEALFKAKCAGCHPNGGNAMKPDKGLKKGDLAKNGIKSKNDIVKYLRKPGPGMSTFDEKSLPKKDAEEVAEYILKTFK
jgi:cytochrome c6